jgi:uncharacterized protein (DUF433 family)
MKINIEESDINDYINCKTTIKKIAEHYNINRNVVSKYFKINNIEKKQLIKEEDILKYVRKEKTLNELAKEYNVSVPNFYSQIIRNGKQRKNFINEEEIINDYTNNNYTIMDIHKKTTFSENLIRKILQKNNIEIKSKSEKINLKDCIQMYNSGCKFSVIASKYNVHPSTIRTLLEKNNIYKKTSGNHKDLHHSFNKTSIFFFKYFDKLNNTNGLYGESEYYVKELNVFLDYVNFDLKLIIEWDEKQHKYKQELDIIRQNNIQKIFPDFTFKRIKE